MANQENIAWIDIETTGLDANDDYICEVACIVTNPAGDVKATKTWVIELTPEAFERLDSNEYVVNMHKKSGLFEALAANEPEMKVSIDMALKELEKFLYKHARYAYLGGFSVHFDKAFLVAKRPTVLKALKHRHVDVTSLDYAMRAAGKEFEKYELPLVVDADGHDVEIIEHRAMADCYIALGAYKRALEWMKGV